MTDPDLGPDPDPVEQANVAAAAIAGFTLAQFAFGELIKNGIVPRGDAEQLLRQAIEAHATAGPGNRAAAELLAVVLQDGRAAAFGNGGSAIFQAALGNSGLP
jgi:hypothetical protein